MTNKLSVNIPDTLSKPLDKLSKELDKSKSFIVKKALAEYFSKYADYSKIIGNLKNNNSKLKKM